MLLQKKHHLKYFTTQLGYNTLMKSKIKDRL